MKTLAVALMVKDEEAIIERCLGSIVRLQPNLVVICDTGSKDNTIVRAGLFLSEQGIKYKIYTDLPFIDFATNRTGTLIKCLMEQDIDYVLMLDADEIVTTAPNFKPQYFKDNLTLDVYHVTMRAGDLTYQLPRLTSNKKDNRYVGVTHEFLSNEGQSVGGVFDIKIQQINDGSRRMIGKKFKHDVELLEEALKDTKNEQLKARYTFYLAQSYAALGNNEQALKYYEQRTNMGQWEEEIFYSYYQMGKIQLPTNPNKAILNFLLAFETCPTRSESLVELKFYFERKGMFHLSEMIEKRLQTIKKPKEGLFVEERKYAYG